MSLWYRALIIYGAVLCAESDTKIELEVWPKPVDGFLHHKVGGEIEKNCINQLDEFFMDYKRPPMPYLNKLYQCSYDVSAPPGQICTIDTKIVGTCSNEFHYNCHRTTPCIYLRLASPPKWIPIFYNNTDDLPKEMPEDLKKYISERKPEERNTVWVSCDGDFPADREYIGPVKYMGMRGFPGYYFPRADESLPSLNPFVTLILSRPSLDIAIGVECRTWAKGLDATAKFFIMVEF